MIRTVVVDRQLAFAALVSGVLRATPDVRVVGYSEAPADLRVFIDRETVDAVLVDRELWKQPEVARVLRGDEAAARSIVLLPDADVPATVAVLREGADGVLPKTAPFDQLLEALRAVHAGQRWVPPECLVDVLTGLLGADGDPDEDRRKLDRLTARERGVLALLVSGVDRNDIATRLFISRHTVRAHIGHILAKFEVGSVVAAIGIGVRAGLLPSEDVIDLRARREHSDDRGGAHPRRVHRRS